MICFLAWCVTTMRPDFDSDDANPEILNTAWCLANGGSIYHDIKFPPYSFAAYPPIYYAVAALPMKWTGLNYLPAKLITLIFTISIGFAFVYLGRLWHKMPRDGIWMAFLCLLIPAVLYNVTRSHPQMMAVALSIWSLVFFSKNRWFPTLVVSPLLAVLAFYTKQSQIVLPLAMVLYLALRNRRWLLPYVAVGGVGGLIPLLWLQHETEGYFLFNVLRLADLPYSLEKISDVLLQWVAPIIFFVILGIFALWRRFQKRLWEPIDFYLALLFPITIISLGRAGSHSQYVVELVIVALLYLLRTAELPDFNGRSVLKMLQLVALMCYTLVFVFVDSVPRNLASIKASEKIYKTIEAMPGPILSQQGSFALLYFILPFVLFDWWFCSARALILGVYLLPCAVVLPKGLDRPMRMALAGFVLVMAVFTIQYRQISKFSPEIENIVRIGESVPAGSRVLPICGYSAGFANPLHHAWAYLVLSRDIVSPYYSAAGKPKTGGGRFRALRYRPGVLEASGSLPWIDESEVRRECSVSDEHCNLTVERLMPIFGKYDRLLLVHPSGRLLDVIQSRLKLQRREGNIYLFSIPI